MDCAKTLTLNGAPGVGAADGPPFGPSRAHGQGLACDQAIFTSIRTPTGEGYRMIAASVAVTGDERAEITRRSPAHGSLCDPEPSAIGLDSYRLERGRRCVAYTTYAGVEHTARGGGRIYSHIALLQREDFRRFDADPLRPHRILGRIFQRFGPVLKPPSRLAPLDLPITDVEYLIPEQADQSPLETNVAAWLWPTAAALLKGERVVLVGPTQPLELARWILLCLPLGLREEMDVSVGLKPSSTRPAHLSITPTLDARSRQFIEGQELTLWDTSHDPPPDVDPFTRWLELLRKWWSEGRLSAITDFTTHTCAHTLPDDLDRLAREWQDYPLPDHQPETQTRVIPPSATAS